MGFDAKGYDPAIRRFENFPDREFDAVICMDVLVAHSERRTSTTSSK